MTFRILCQQPAGGFKRLVVAQAGEDVQYFAGIARGMAHTIGRQQGKAECPGELNRPLVQRFFFAIEVPLDFDVHVVVSEDVDQPFKPAFAFIDPASPIARTIRPGNAPT